MELEQIWSEYRGALHGFLRKRVGNEADVEDLLQEVLIKTHAHLGELREAGALRGWLFQVARNATTDFYRKQGRTRNIAAEDLWYGDDDDDDHEVRRDLEKCVAPFLAALSAADAALLQAVDIQGQSQKDYAAEQGVAYSTLKSRVHSARAKLADQYRACCELTISATGEVMDYVPKAENSGDC